MQVSISIDRLVWVILLIALVVVSVTALMFPTTHVINKQGTPVRVNFNALTPIGLPINVSLSVPVYVVGSQSLTQRLVSIGLPQSLVKPIAVPDLSLVPPGSVVVVDWGYLLSYY